MSTASIFSLIFLCAVSLSVCSQDSIFITVHFLHGSKPCRKFKEVEPKWFGGKLGGHVGIEIEKDKLLNFLPHGKFHWFAKKKNKHSTFAVHSQKQFWQLFGSAPDAVKKTSVTIPVTANQKVMLNSIYINYIRSTPYDYAFIGMRCGAAAADILGKAAIMKKYSYRKTYLKFFYPKKLRKPLLKKAKANNWKVAKQEGSPRRKWERD